jgi:drug/metabolite transporter superfamily protein YnfA
VSSIAIRKTRWKYDIRAAAAAGLVLVVLICAQRKPAQVGRVYAAQRAVTESMLLMVTVVRPQRSGARPAGKGLQ